MTRQVYMRCRNGERYSMGPRRAVMGIVRPETMQARRVIKEAKEYYIRRRLWLAEERWSKECHAGLWFAACHSLVWQDIYSHALVKLTGRPA
jgi:hypothetical protein